VLFFFFVFFSGTMDSYELQLANFNREMELFASRHSREERAHNSNSSNMGPKEGNPEEKMLEAIRTSQMAYEQTLNGCLEASALRFSGLEASLRRIEVHIGTIMEAMQRQESEKFPFPPKLEEVTTIPWSGENVEHDFSHYFANDSSSTSGEEVGKEEMRDKVKETKPYIPPTTFPCRLRKSKWYRLFSELTKSLFQVNIYLPLFYVIRNTPAVDKYFQDLIAYGRKFEALEFG
jgi:hypothetical protein